MNVLFLTVSRINTLEVRGIYTDLMKKFRDEGHNVFIVSPTERRFKNSTYLINENKIKILKVKTLNIQKTNMIEKGIGSLLLNSQYRYAINKHFKDVKFDLILYSTPPITLTSAISSLKKRNSAKTYLLLKDIFPQNAVDIGLIKKDGILHHYFKTREKRMYAISDHIGCMSKRNVDYLLENNPEIDKTKVEVNPNSIDIVTDHISDKEIESIKRKYQVPIDKTVLIYGGNLGKPQGIDFLIKVLKSNINNKEVYFLIIGNGTEYIRLSSWFNENKPYNANLIPTLPKDEYDRIVKICDVGLIFLDKRFSIPNFPSRILSYMENKKPIITATDSSTDIGEIAEKNCFGFSTVNENINKFNQCVNKFAKDKMIVKKMGENAFNFLKDNYTTDNSYRMIINKYDV